MQQSEARNEGNAAMARAFAVLACFAVQVFGELALMRHDKCVRPLGQLLRLVHYVETGSVVDEKSDAVQDAAQDA